MEFTEFLRHHGLRPDARPFDNCETSLETAAFRCGGGY